MYSAREKGKLKIKSLYIYSFFPFGLFPEAIPSNADHESSYSSHANQWESNRKQLWLMYLPLSASNQGHYYTLNCAKDSHYLTFCQSTKSSYLYFPICMCRSPTVSWKYGETFYKRQEWSVVPEEIKLEFYLVTFFITSLKPKSDVPF